MPSEQTIDEALLSGLPLAIVGTDVAEAVRNRAITLGFRLALVDARRIVGPDSLDDLKTWHAASPTPWVVMIVDAHLAERTGDLPADAPRTGEDLLLDIAFDGHPALPAGTVVALAFDEPTDLSEALADDAVPCAFIGGDSPLPHDAIRLAA